MAEERTNSGPAIAADFTGWKRSNKKFDAQLDSVVHKGSGPEEGICVEGIPVDFLYSLGARGISVGQTANAAKALTGA